MGMAQSKIPADKWRDNKSWSLWMQLMSKATGTPIRPELKRFVKVTTEVPGLFRKEN
jgi:hypothetical protein